MNALHINRGPGPVIEVKRDEVGVRWCFVCRKRVRFDYVVSRYDCDPLEDWYGPWPAIRCERNHVNGDLFPGRERIWEEA